MTSQCRLRPGDRFNEYTIGRSKEEADLTAKRLKNGRFGKDSEIFHSMSNQHCRIYCTLSSSGGDYDKAEMEVYVESMSSMGTLINGNTLLLKNERCRLRTGDIICLIRPIAQKYLGSPATQKMYVAQYSYRFVNHYEQNRGRELGDTRNTARPKRKRNVDQSGGDVSPRNPFAKRQRGKPGVLTASQRQANAIAFVNEIMTQEPPSMERHSSPAQNHPQMLPLPSYIKPRAPTRMRRTTPRKTKNNHKRNFCVPPRKRYDPCGWGRQRLIKKMNRTQKNYN